MYVYIFTFYVLLSTCYMDFVESPEKIKASDVKEKSSNVRQKKLFEKPIVLLELKESRKNVSLTSPFLLYNKYSNKQKLTSSNLNAHSSLLF